mmetsp:Transcript_29596/g.81334  ORF Transcript_29596/g.81334 Transcript_29596/m.81334 type:complete len:427 (-) Transcript_29596:130-1410(-)
MNGILLFAIHRVRIRRQGLLQIPNDTHIGQRFEQQRVGSIVSGTVRPARIFVMIFVKGFSHEGFKHPRCQRGQPFERNRSNALVTARLVDAQTHGRIGHGRGWCGMIIDVKMRRGKGPKNARYPTGKECPLLAQIGNQRDRDNDIGKKEQEIDQEHFRRQQVRPRFQINPIVMRFVVQPPEPRVAVAGLRRRMRIFGLIAMLVMSHVLGGPPQASTLQTHGGDKAQYELDRSTRGKSPVRKVPMQTRRHANADKGNTGHAKDGDEWHEGGNLQITPTLRHDEGHQGEKGQVGQIHQLLQYGIRRIVHRLPSRTQRTVDRVFGNLGRVNEHHTCSGLVSMMMMMKTAVMTRRTKHNDATMVEIRLLWDPRFQQNKKDSNQSDHPINHHRSALERWLQFAAVFRAESSAGYTVGSMMVGQTVLINRDK